MIYIIQTYKDDQCSCHIAAERVKELDSDAKIIIYNDPKNPADEKYLSDVADEIKSTTCERAGNLNGLNFILSELEIFTSYSEPVVKMDSDTWLNSIDWLKGNEDCDIVWLEKSKPLEPSGLIYRINPQLALKIIDYIKKRLTTDGFQQHQYPEDMTIFHVASLIGAKQYLVPFTRYGLTGFYESIIHTEAIENQNVYAVHCGEPIADSNFKVTGGAERAHHVLMRMEYCKLLSKYNELRGVKPGTIKVEYPLE